jgi:outer membrane protein assembly factor BamB
LTQWSRVLGAAIGLLLLSVVLSACGAAPVAQNWPGLTVADETVSVISGSPQQVYILDAKTGTQKATFMPQAAPRGIFYWSPVIVGGNLAFVGFADSQSRTSGLYAFDPGTGQELWHIAAQNLILPAPAYADGVVYFGDSDGHVYAVDVETKSVKPGWPFQAKEAIWASPLVAAGRVYVAAMDHHLYCLDAETGEKLWDAEVGGAMAARPTLDASRGTLYVGAFDGQVYAIRADSGEIVPGFHFQAENWIWSEVLVAGDRLYVTSLDGKLYALDPASGQVIPPYPFDSAQFNGNKKDPIRAAPAQAGESLIIATESGRVIAVREAEGQLSGQVYWPSGIPQASILTTPVVSAGTICVVLANGTVQTLNAENGAVGWAFASPQSQ